ncbi:tetratricopeptide repeat protein [Occallatibacter savannae]|uniref:tetratricopeptide repeat protein n=1 Tax=Occallatibacter savannae TaxID=1002691 RepID=UPI000D68EDFC|nr:tetratricopeptide repeat protein [Occallatibacter savannae]
MDTAEIQTLLKLEILIKILAQAVDATQRGQLEMAEKGFASLDRVADSEPTTLLRHVKPLALLGLALVRTKQRDPEQSRILREQAVAALDDDCRNVPLATFHYFMALEFFRLQDYRNALPFWELALQHAKPDMDPMLVAEMLQKLGECYSRMGLGDHAAIPLRAALKILAKFPEHPWRPATLITLGNALRKTAPAEAEAAFREAAEIHAAKLQYQSAAPAWVNLGILCAEQGRFEESLAFYTRVLRVRENDASTPPERIALLHNNIAGCYRRWKKSDEALASVDRSISLFPPSDPQRAYAYSTKAMTLRDAGRDQEAVTWFRTAIDERKKQASPSFEAYLDDLQGLIDALKRLHRDTELPPVEEELAQVLRQRDSIQSAQTGADRPEFSGGSVLIEIPNTNQADLRTREEVRDLVYTLAGALAEGGIGRISGHITSPETRTLIFTGDDAERLFDFLNPRLSSDPFFSGARIVIRQADQSRELFLPTRTTAVN